MPQILNQLKNPWGLASGQGVASLEPQRSDLFTVDFSLPLQAIRTILTRAAGGAATATAAQLAANLLAALPQELEFPYYANAVELPDARVSTSTVKRHDIPYSWPGMDEVLGQIAITFTLDAPLVDASRSKVMAFLRAWRAIVRGGRAGQSVGELPLDLLAASREGRSLIPDFRHNFAIYLWRGQIPSGDLFSLGDSFTPANAGMELASQWTVTKGWLSGVQPPALRHAQGAIGEVRATFQAESITEEGVQAGSIAIGPIKTVS